MTQNENFVCEKWNTLVVQILGDFILSLFFPLTNLVMNLPFSLYKSTCMCVPTSISFGIGGQLFFFPFPLIFLSLLEMGEQFSFSLLISHSFRMGEVFLFPLPPFLLFFMGEQYFSFFPPPTCSFRMGGSQLFLVSQPPFPFACLLASWIPQNIKGSCCKIPLFICISTLAVESFSLTYKDTNPEVLYTQCPISHLIGYITLLMMMIGLSFICILSSWQPHLWSGFGAHEANLANNEIMHSLKLKILP